LITVKDIQKVIKYPNACKDELGRLRWRGRRSGTRGDRAREGSRRGARDVLVVDTAHGHSRGVLDMVAKVRETFPGVQLCGNVGTAQGAAALIERG